MKSKIDLLNGSIPKALLALMYPILICNIFQQLYNMADAIVIGNFAGDIGIAIVGGSCNTLTNLFRSICNHFTLACMMVTAYFYGAHDTKKVGMSIKTSIMTVCMLGLLFSLIYIFLAEPLLQALKVPSNIIEPSVSYLRLYSIGFIPYIFFLLMTNSLRALGESKIPTRLLIISFIINIFFDYMFVGIFHFEQYGIAYAFILSQMICDILAWNSIRHRIHIDIFKTKIEIGCLNRILQIGLPACISSLCFQGTNVLVQSSINLLGSEMITYFAICSKIDRFFTIMMEGLAVAVTALIGQNYGAKKYNRIMKIVLDSGIVGMIIAVILSVLCIQLGKPLISLFTSDKLTIENTAAILSFKAAIYFTYPMVEVIQCVLKCLGKSVQSTVIAIVTICGVRCAWILFYALHHLSYKTVLLCYPLSWGLASLVYVGYYFIVKKKELSLK